MPDKWLNETGLAYYTGEIKKQTDRRYHRQNIGRTVDPIYNGDFINDEMLIPNSVVVVGNYVYICETYNTDENLGYIAVYDRVNNVRVPAMERTLPIGHANSITFNPDTNEFFIAPSFTLSGETVVNSLNVLIYDQFFNLRDTIVLPENIHTVTYDHAAGELYAYNILGHFYKWDNSIRDFVRFADMTENVRTYNQGLAVWDGHFYISGPYGYVLTGYFDGSKAVVDGGFSVGYYDTRSRFDMRELEDFNFTDDGHLIAIKYTRVATDVYCGFVVELPVGVANPYNEPYGAVFVRGVDEYRITAASKNSLYNDEYRLKSINQINVLINNQFSRVLVLDDTTERVLYVRGNVKIIVQSAVLTVHHIELTQGDLNINTEAGKIIFTTDGFPIVNESNGTLIISGTACNFEFTALSSPVALSRPGASGSRFMIRVVPADVVLTIAGTTITNNTVMFGGEVIHRG